VPTAALGHSRHFERAPATSVFALNCGHQLQGGEPLVAPTSGPRGNNPPGPMVSTIDSRWSLCPPLRPRALRRYWSRHLRSGRASKNLESHRSNWKRVRIAEQSRICHNSM
jgi:hypothetical protein